jgi:predicted hotdog family 3-hydroxylacyl-ACP dehydratase
MDSPHRFPISTLTLQEMLPHRPPMVWIDQVESVDESGGTCKVLLKKNGLQCSPEGLRQSTLVEWLAQGAGFAQASVVKNSVKNAYLVSVNQLEYCDHETWLRFQEKLTRLNELPITIHIKIVRALGPVTLFSGEIFENETLLGKGTFKTFSE